MIKYYIHHEGYISILCAFLFCAILIVGLYFTHWNIWIKMGITVVLAAIFFLVIFFFRMPEREMTKVKGALIAPADGTIVHVEKVFEDEYFHEERLQVSIFMSPLNVHVNRYPINGVVKDYQYHPGKYLVAWHPKSSKLNERTTVVLEAEGGAPVLLRQIAGAVARRIVCYAKSGDSVTQNQEMGFIKFGSRVDLFLPLDTDIKVAINQKVKGGIDIIGYLPASFDK